MHAGTGADHPILSFSSPGPITPAPARLAAANEQETRLREEADAAGQEENASEDDMELTKTLARVKQLQTEKAEREARHSTTRPVPTTTIFGESQPLNGRIRCWKKVGVNCSAVLSNPGTYFVMGHKSSRNLNNKTIPIFILLLLCETPRAFISPCWSVIETARCLMTQVANIQTYPLKMSQFAPVPVCNTNNFLKLLRRGPLAVSLEMKSQH